jgi:hypothetical protein
MERAERSYQQYFQLPLFRVLLASAFLEQMTKGIPGIRPAVISAEPGTRMDEDYNCETTPANNLECKAEEKTSHIVLVNATWFSTFS